MQRTFVVGCPRSGTTLVQALLARHPAVQTLPETAFFEHLHGDLEWRWGDQGAKQPRHKWRHHLGFAHQRARETLVRLQGNLSDGSRQRSVPWRVDHCASRFVRMLDEYAAAEGHTMWLEKTPYHLLYIPEIEREVPRARFIHVIRNGEEVLASVADANMRFDRNGAFGGGTMHWARRWNRAAQIHRANAGRPQHHFVFLEELIANEDAEWRRLCRFLGLDPELDLDEKCSQAVADLANEPWKQGAIHGVPRPIKCKAERVFGPQVRQWLQRHLLSYDELRQACATTDARR
jgi:hypothetical protein